MHVNLPSNCDDEAISCGSCSDKPLSEPTEMSYFLFRCRLSVIFRELIDEVTAQGIGIDEIDYDQVLNFDRKLNTFIDTVPYFLKSDSENRQRCRELDKERPYLIWQRLMAQFGASTRISRLHRPYLARGARTILDFERTIRNEATSLSARTHPGEYGLSYEPYAEARIQEITECCHTLEAAKEVSGIVARGLEELKNIMKKWGLLTDVEPSGDSNNGEKREAAAPMQENNPLLPAPGQEAMQIQATQMERTFPPSWMESWDFNVDLDYPQWDALFHDLESRSVLYGSLLSSIKRASYLRSVRGVRNHSQAARILAGENFSRDVTIASAEPHRPRR
ncbi:uncharacterized protein CIMG_06850 [Coccidioides immitis RS]|uniref:Uncharacterized protein n=1 Tax=Coccidioides immitis (strain RS) TaxID=246410 RepID=J3K925_COCIM|nr:uncharacterized protein CIMG_06850 [Coccidioides immitis RS]EAS31371.3 hypothetical protein CIMG_06850 [Coccidioides immitis RS]